MTTAERQELISIYSKAYEQLEEAMQHLPKEMWKWKPAPDKWSVHEIIIHLADSEANSYIRCRRFIAEPGSGVYGYNENAWAEKLQYHHQSTNEALLLFKLLRQSNYHLVQHVDEATWQSATVHHSENGLMTFEEWLRIYTEHVPVHIRQMQRNLAAWQHHVM